MKKLFILSIILLTCYSCKNITKQENLEQSSRKVHLTEVITKSYSPKLVNGKTIIDTLQQMQSITIDRSQKEIENTYYNLDGTPSWIDKFDYDENGNKIGSNFFENGENQTIYYKYKNDSLGRRIFYEAFDINTDTVLYDGASKYAANGLLKKDGYVNRNGEFKWNFEYIFDTEGKELGYVYIDLQSGMRYPSTYEYMKFNQNNDWIRRRVIENGKIQSIEIREFLQK